MRNLCLKGTVHRQYPRMMWFATICGLRWTLEERGRFKFTETDDLVDCMTCLVRETQEKHQ